MSIISFQKNGRTIYSYDEDEFKQELSDLENRRKVAKKEKLRLMADKMQVADLMEEYESDVKGSEKEIELFSE